MKDHLLQQALTALKAGRKAQARALLAQVVGQDPKNAQAWLWLSGAVDTDAQRRACLERVLALDPGNVAAKRGLTVLQTKAGVSQPVPQTNLAPATRPPAPAGASAVNATPDHTRSTTLQNEAERKQFWWLLGLAGVLGLLMLGLAIVLSLTGGESQDAQLPVTPKGPHVVVYGRQACSLTRRMMEDLEQRAIPCVFKSIDDQQVRDELYPRLRASGHRGSLALPVVEVNGQLLIRPKITTVVEQFNRAY